MKKYLGIFIVLLFSGVVYSQSAEVITEMLNSPEANYGQVCYLAAIKQGLISENDSYDDAIQINYKKNQVFENVDKDCPVVYVNLAYIFSNVFTIKGSLMYKITNGAPRYAFRQMQADGVIPKEARPAVIVSGSEVLRMFTSCMSKYENINLSDVNMND